MKINNQTISLDFKNTHSYYNTLRADVYSTLLKIQVPAEFFCFPTAMPYKDHSVNSS